jgi:predicted nucleic acid-binding protein
MRHLVLDTNVLADFFAGDPETVEAFQRAASLAVNTVVLGELLAGFAAALRRRLRRPSPSRRKGRRPR